MANRHGLIAGATGTGKTVTARVLAEAFSDLGVPVFMADVKGDLAGILAAGTDSENMQERIARFGLAGAGFSYQGYPVTLWDIYGRNGIPLRTTVTEMGPLLMARILQLNDLQTDILSIVYRIADDEELLLVDIKDLKSMLNYVQSHSREYTEQYGRMSSASIGAILRALVALEGEGGDQFFGETALNIADWMQAGMGGKGMINILDSQSLFTNGRLYATFLLWLLSELYAQLPEVGDMDLPKLVFFFDEAHMLFDETSKALVDKIEQVVRLIRSKGVGVYFITQSPTDIPEDILGQLGNRVQHALRAFTPKDQKAVKTAADTFRANPEFKTADAIMELGTGEALVSFLDAKGAPSMVERAKILFPLSQIGAVTEAQRTRIINQSRLYGKYDKVVDRESAFEVLMAEAEAALKAEEEAAAAEKAAKEEKKSGRSGGGLLKGLFGAMVGAAVTSVTSSIGSEVSKKVTGKKSRTTGKDIAGKAIGSAARTATRQLTRSVLGTLIK
jgi:DNA helicase HerA-like ATPase